MCRELSKNNETGTKVGTDRKGREEERSVWGRDDGETRELVPEKKKGHKGFAFIGHALHVGHGPSLFLPFTAHALPSILPSRLISRPTSKLLRSTPTLVPLCPDSHPALYSPVIFSRAVKKTSRRNYFNAYVRSFVRSFIVFIYSTCRFLSSIENEVSSMRRTRRGARATQRRIFHVSLSLSGVR